MHGLKPLDPLPQVLADQSAGLESLDLSYCSRVGDVGAGALQGLSALRRLDLTWTAVTPVGLRVLAAGLPRLESLQPGTVDSPKRRAASTREGLEAAIAVAA